MPDNASMPPGFAEDKRGNIAIMFALSIMMLTIIVGLAIDSGRAYHARTKIANAIDAAALVAARGMREGNMTDAQIVAIAQKFFDENMKGSGEGWIDIQSFDVDIDHDNSSVAITVDGEVETTFGKLAGVNSFDIPATTLAVYKSKDIELSLSLDMTGSMSGSKMASLKLATHDLIDIMMPDSGTSNTVRIGFAPYAAGVNAGNLTSAVTGLASPPNNCVYERKGSNKTKLIAPGPGNYLSTKLDHPGAQPCPAVSKVLPLSDDKTVLHAEVNRFNASGSTAGHLGTAWAGYLLNPEWNPVLPAGSHPVAYGEANTIKAVLLMTDGEYNTYGGSWGGAAQSGADARALCDEIKSKQTVVYSIGFQLNNAEAISILQHCASSPAHYYAAEDEDTLRAVFRAIAVELNSLRLAK